MKERPVLFTPANAQLVFDHRKTQTRRVITPQPFSFNDGEVTTWEHENINGAYEEKVFAQRMRDYGPKPFGVVGDRLWVREAWRPFYEKDTGAQGIQFKGGGFEENDRAGEAANGTDKWRHARFMFRWCSRTLLEITDIRVERLQSISEEDAIAEGVSATPYSKQDIADIQISDCAPEIKQLAAILGPGQFTAKANYMMLWDSINGLRYNWSSNPWVWSIHFKRLEAWPNSTV